MDIDGKLTVDVESGFIEGKGNDDHGAFVIRGFISANLSVSFIMQYDEEGKLWHFRGMLNKQRNSISGHYGENPKEFSGRFNLKSTDHEENDEDDDTNEWEEEYK
jgi:hypothetical protein